MKMGVGEGAAKGDIYMKLILTKDYPDMSRKAAADKQGSGILKNSACAGKRTCSPA